MIRAKFDQNAPQPDSIIFSAINSSLGNLAYEGNVDILTRLKHRITSIVGPGVSILTTLIPNLENFVHCIPVDDDGQVPATTQQQRSKMSKYLLCSLLRALCTPQNPVVLLIDDLQWADQTSLDLVQQLVADHTIRYCYCIISYRDDDKRLTPRVTDKLNVTRTQGINLQTIGLGPIEKESVNALISEALCLPPSLSRPLSSLLRSKTGGKTPNFLCYNTQRYFVLQFRTKILTPIIFPFSISIIRCCLVCNKVSTDAKQRRIDSTQLEHKTLGV